MSDRVGRGCFAEYCSSCCGSCHAVAPLSPCDTPAAAVPAAGVRATAAAHAVGAAAACFAGTLVAGVSIDAAAGGAACCRFRGSTAVGAPCESYVALARL